MEYKDNKEKKRLQAIEKELYLAVKKEKSYEKAALARKNADWKHDVEKKIPEKVVKSLDSAFAKAFSFVFKHGTNVIEKSYHKDSLLDDHAILDFAFRTKCTRKELREIRRSADRANYKHVALTTAEGIGLGALGVGLPDIVLFLGVLLRGIYETALRYGYDYESRAEQLLILKMMAASLSSGDAFSRLNQEINERIAEPQEHVTEEEFHEQLDRTAKLFSADMLLLKFIQGLPLVGIIGGAANPVYYQRVLNYVRMRYHKRFLQKLYWEQYAEESTQNDLK